ncbi:MAG: LUD domain-containing protein [Akkermansiaceae bacterium]|nr:LUD domain-containing protein [Akkermansiaceae bacterium]
MSSRNSRSSIFEKIHQALGESSAGHPLPDYDDALLHSAPRLEGNDLWEIFSRNFAAVSGISMTGTEGLLDLLKESDCNHGYCDPALMHTIGDSLVAAGLTVETEYDRKRYDDYQFGITRAAGAIAESGSVILNDETTSDRLAALSPWVHIAVLENESSLLRSIPDAVAAFGASPNIIWATGPSKTADVEGILIEGVHGPGRQVLVKL